MFSLTIQEKGGAVTVREFDQPEVTVGRIQGIDNFRDRLPAETALLTATLSIHLLGD